MENEKEQNYDRNQTWGPDQPAQPQNAAAQPFQTQGPDQFAQYQGATAQPVQPQSFAQPAQPQNVHPRNRKPNRHNFQPVQDVNRAERDDSLETGAKKFSPGWSVYYVLETALFTVAGLFLMGTGIFGGLKLIFAMGLASVLMAVFDIKRAVKKQYPKGFFKTFGASILMFIVFFFVLLRPSSFSSHNTDSYEIQRTVLEMATDTDDFFPASLPEDIDDYKFSCKTSLFGKESRVSLRYHFAGKTADKDRLMHKLAGNYSYSLMKGVRLLSSYEMPDDKDTELDYKNAVIYYDKDFWSGKENRATVVILRSEGTAGKPKTQAVIIDTQDGMIEYIQIDQEKI